MTIPLSHPVPAVAAPPLPQDISAFQDACAALRALIGNEVYDSWFGRLELVGITGETATVSVPTKFLKVWIAQHYEDTLAGVFAAARPGVTRVEVKLRSSARAVPTLPPIFPSSLASRTFEATTATPSAAPPTPSVPEAKPLVPRGDLSNARPLGSLIVGSANRHAHAAAALVAQQLAADGSADLLRNPLTFLGPTGVGKTSLAEGIVGAARDAGREVVVLDAFRLASLARAHTQVEVVRDVATADALVVDDLHHLKGGPGSETFSLVLRQLLARGRQVILTSTEPLGSLASLSDETISRLAGGLVVVVDPPDATMRAALLDAIALRLGFVLDPDIRDAVAALGRASARGLEGVVRAIAHHSALDGALGVEGAIALIRPMLDIRTAFVPKIEDIQRAVADFYDVRRTDMMSSRRTANVVRPRQIAMFLSKSLTLRSLPEIGRRFGGRDHTTVLHAVNKISRLVAEDPTLKADVGLLTLRLNAA